MAAGSNFVFPKNLTKVIINFSELCRFCLCETQNDISIKDRCLPEESSEIEQDTIYNFVTKLKIIKMTGAENFPSLVCKNCHEVIKICYNFIRVCQKSEDILNSCYERCAKETKEKINFSNAATADFCEKNLEVINVETNNQEDKKLMGISKAHELKLEKIVFISDIKQFSENFKSNDFTDSTGITSERENYCSLCSIKFNNVEALNHHYTCTHEKKYKKLLVKQENPIHYKTANKKQVPKQFEDVNKAKNVVEADVKAFCFHCAPCKEFHIMDDFLLHVKAHKVKNCFICPCCRNEFPSILNLNHHLMSLHNPMADFVSLDDVKFLRKKSKNTGMRGDKLIHSVKDLLNFYQDKNRNFKVCCTNCNPPVDFHTTNGFITHMAIHHSNSKFTEKLAAEGKTEMKYNSNLKCSDCPTTHSQKQYLLHKMKQKHNIQYPESKQCPVCSETFLTNRKVIQHGITAHQKYFANFHNVYNKIIQPSHEEALQNKNFECDMCKKKYIFKTSLKRHIFSAHLGEPKGSIACPHCGKTLANKFNLKSHIEFKHQALFVSCPICKKKINFRTIGRHYKVHQNASEIGLKNSYLCTQCGKILMSKRSFEDHQKLHKNIRNELCDVCGGGYATKKALRLHKKTHEGIQRKLYECDQCDKVFSGRHTLNRHLLTHSGVKNFICEICSKCFYTLQELKRHVRYHKKEYRFECQQCDMRFVDKSRFRHHLMKHKNIRPHKCQFCEKMFIVRGKMNLHMASKHNYRVDTRRVWKDPKAYIPLNELL